MTTAITSTGQWFTRHDAGTLIDARIIVRRWIQPTLRPGDPQREPKGEFAGTVLYVDRGGRITLDSSREAIFPEPQFLGGDPQTGTARWLVTDIEKAP